MKTSADWTFSLGRIRGVELRMHIVCVLLLAWIAIHYFVTAGFGAKIEGVIFALLVLGSVVLHELGHVMAARLCRVGARGITIFPFGGITHLQRVPNRPAKEIGIALAGPAVSAMLAAFFFVWAVLISSPNVFTLLHKPGGEMTSALASVNAALCLLNLLPIFPLDGGRIARHLLARRVGDAQAIRTVAMGGQAVAIAIGFMGLFGQPLLVLVAVVLFAGAAHEASVAEIKETSSVVPVSNVMVRDFRTVPGSAPLNQAVDALLATSQHEFPVTDAEGKLCGMLSREDIVRGLQAALAATPVSEVMQPGGHHIPLGTPLDRALALLEESGSQAIPVLDESGRIVGLFTMENISEMLLLQTAMASHQPLFAPRMNSLSGAPLTVSSGAAAPEISPASSPVAASRAA